ncbi:PAS domain S-box protein [Aliifodinibius sp. S!AR15-10]|nr:PAS domain S-box protein [Aliifodinibius sp. S!AR15-10]
MIKCRINLDGTWDELPSLFCELLGYTKQELQSKSFYDLLKTNNGTGNTIFQDLADGDCQEFEAEKEFCTKSGEVIPLFLSGALIRDQQGKPDYVLCYIHEMTDNGSIQKAIERTQQHFQSIFRHNPHPVYIFDLEGNFQRVNQKLVEFTGYSREELLETDFRSFIVEEDLDRTIRQFKAAASGKSGEYEIQVKIKGGEKKDIRVTKFPMYVGDEVQGVFGILQDITEQKKRKRKLRESEERFRLMFENNPIPVYYFDTEGKFLGANQKFEELSGYTKEELKERTFEPFVHPDYRESTWQNFKKALSGEVQESEIIGITRDGEERVVHLTTFPLMMDGKPQGVFGICVDITSEKEARRKLKNSEERWQRLVEENPQPVQIVQDGKIVFINEEGAKLYEASSREELIGQSILDFSHPDYLDELLERKRRLEQRERIESGEHKILLPDGKEKYIEAHSIPIQYKGEKAIQTVIHDITDRKNAEEALKKNEKQMSRLFSNLPGIAYRCKNTPNWPMRFISEGCQELTGYEPETFMHDEEGRLSYGDVIHKEDREFVWQHIQDAIRHNRSFELEYRIVDKHDNMKWVWERGVAIEGAKEDEIILEGFISDITSQKQADRQIRENLEEKKVLLQEIHHRVKNNLAVISGLLELQAMNTDDEAAISTLRESQLRIQSMAMVHQKLYQSDAFSNIGFNDYVKELVQTIESTYGLMDKEIDIVFDMAPVKLNINQAIPCALIINELVANSFKHAFHEQKEGTIEIHLNKSEALVELRVKDDGKGVDPDFDINSQESLGMTLINTLTRQLEGELELISDNDKPGTEIVVDFEVD